MKRRNFIKGMGLVGAAAYIDPFSLINPNSLSYPNQLWKPTIKALYTPTFPKFQLDKGKLKGLVKQRVMDIKGDNLIFCWPFHSSEMLNKSDGLERFGGIAKGQEYIKLEQTQLENLGLKEIGSLTDNTLHNINPSKMLNWAVDQNKKLEDINGGGWEPYDIDDGPAKVHGLKIITKPSYCPSTYEAVHQPVYSIPIKNFGQLVDYCSYQFHAAYEHEFAMSKLSYCINWENHRYKNLLDKSTWKLRNIDTESLKIHDNMVIERSYRWRRSRPELDEWYDPIEYKGSHYARGCPEKKTGCYKWGEVDNHGICHTGHGSDYDQDYIDYSLGKMQMIAGSLSKDDDWIFGVLPKWMYGDLCSY